MKVFLFLSAVFFLVQISSSSIGKPTPFTFKQSQVDAPRVDAPRVVVPRVNDGQYCGLCIQFAGQFINQLLNIVLQVGVVGGCSDLCGILAQKVNSNIAGEVCEILCAIVGIKEFIAIINEADLDPIYYCELLTACEVKDDGDATILSFSVKPSAVPRGSTFNISVAFSTKNGTGTGEIDVLIHTQDHIPLGQSELMKPKDSGTYHVFWLVKAEADADCDPTQGPCEMWLPGNYSVEVAICNGECGSKHPHSQVYDQSSADFTVVDSKGSD